jgi:hypothetical protein
MRRDRPSEVGEVLAGEHWRVYCSRHGLRPAARRYRIPLRRVLKDSSMRQLHDSHIARLRTCLT